MSHSAPPCPVRRKPAFGLLAIAAFALMTGCLRPSPYLDAATREVPRNEFKAANPPRVAHLVFEFQTKGAPNARVTKSLVAQVTQQIKDCGLFSDIDAAVSPDAAMLSVTLNNVPITDQKDAMGQGFATGFTFGLVGTAVTDGYICTVSYLAPGKTTPIVATARHAIHTTIGNASAPKDAIPMADYHEAVGTMVRQVLSNALRDLSRDAQF